MKTESSGQARPRTRSKPLGNGADKPWSVDPGSAAAGTEPEPGQVQVSQADAVPIPSREEKIAIIAYFKAERRGFSNSGELDDWLEAEREVDRLASGKDTE